MYTSTRDRVKHEIAQVQFFSATADMWLSTGMTPYQSYTIHFIDDEWKLQPRCLQTQFLSDDHTGANLAEAMEAALESWELCTTKQVCLTTDNGANIVCAADLLSWPRFSCFGHNLHLAITNRCVESCPPSSLSSFQPDRHALRRGVCHCVCCSTNVEAY